MLGSRQPQRLADVSVMCIVCVGASNKNFFGIFAHWGKAHPTLPSASGRENGHLRVDVESMCVFAPIRSMSRHIPCAVMTARTARGATTAMFPRAMTEESGGLSPYTDDPPLSPTVHDSVWPRTRTSDGARTVSFPAFPPTAIAISFFGP